MNSCDAMTHSVELKQIVGYVSLWKDALTLHGSKFKGEILTANEPKRWLLPVKTHNRHLTGTRTFCPTNEKHQPVRAGVFRN